DRRSYPAARPRPVGHGRPVVTMFRRSGDHVVARFAPDEVNVLRRVAAEVVGLLTDGFDRDDPVVHRLFPDPYPDHPEASKEYRRYTEGDLKTAKIDQAGAVLAALPSSGGGEVRLDTEAAEAWLRALNDIQSGRASWRERTWSSGGAVRLTEVA